MSKKPSDNKMSSAGQLLRMRRIDLGISIEQASEDTRIQKKYLEMIERDEYDNFDTEVFLRGYLKSYSKYLGLRQDKIIAIYRRSNPQKESSKKPVPNAPKPTQKSKISAKSIAEIILASFVVVVVIYFAYQLYSFQKIPNLEIYTPENNITVTDDKIELSGKSESNTIVTINDVATELDENHEFNDSIALNEGINTISIQAVRKNNESKETQKILTITKEEAEEEAPVEAPKPEEPVLKDKFTLKVEGGDAWILLVVDGNQELGQIVTNGFTNTYTVKDKMELTTGRFDITKIYLNDSTEPVQLNLSSGVGVLTCTLVNNLLTCDNQ